MTSEAHTPLTPDDQPWRELEQLVERGAQPDMVDAYLDSLSSADAARALSRLSEDDQTSVLSTLSPEDAADLIEELPDAQAAELMEHIEPHSAAAILHELPSDEQADILGDLGPARAEAILDAMAPQEAEDALRLCTYEDDVAGGLMMTEFVQYGLAHTVREVIVDLRDNADKYRDYAVQYAYIVDDDDRLVGVLPLRMLLFSRRDRPVREVMISDPLALEHMAGLDALEQFFDRHHFIAVPVVDGTGRMVGVVRRVSVERALRDKNDADYRRAQGLVSEELRSMPLLHRSRRRLAWLSVNIGLNVVAASIIALYQDTLASFIALAVFLPIISDMSGCSGNQSVAVSMRELALGLVKPGELRYVLMKELVLGLMNGIVLGALIGITALLWQGNPSLGFVVGAALAINTTIAVCIGGTIPLILKRLRKDPALASGPILTTITDMCGFLILLSMASALLTKPQI